MGKQKPIYRMVLSKYLYVALFIIGAIAFAYPLITSTINLQTQTRVITTYEQERAALDEAEKERLLEEARDYNRYVSDLEGNVTDEITPDEAATTDIVYLSVLSTGEAIGAVVIPKIDVELPIFHGASEQVLERGIGHLERSSLPIGGESTHSVLSGHRGLPSSRLFRDLDKMDVGDVFFIDTLSGRLAYRIESIQRVLPYQVESLQVQPGRDLCTLITCDPYMINSHRMLVTGQSVPYDEALLTEQEEAKISFFDKYVDYFVIAGFFALLAFIIWLIRRRVKGRAVSRGLEERTAGDGDA